MWQTNRKVQQVYTTHHSQNTYAIIEGLSGWQKVASNTASGVTNLTVILSTASANGRRVDVYVTSNEISRAILR